MVDAANTGRVRTAFVSAVAPTEKRRRVVAGLADHEVERAIVLLSGIRVFVDDVWLPLLTAESRRRGLPITREN